MSGTSVHCLCGPVLGMPMTETISMLDCRMARFWFSTSETCQSQWWLWIKILDPDLLLFLSSTCQQHLAIQSGKTCHSYSRNFVFPVWEKFNCLSSYFLTTCWDLRCFVNLFVTTVNWIMHHMWWPRSPANMSFVILFLATLLILWHEFVSGMLYVMNSLSIPAYYA